MRMKKFLNTPFGSWFKVFITTILSLYLASGKGIFELDINSLKDIVSCGIAATLPVIINYLNSEEPRYGITKKSEDGTKQD